MLSILAVRKQATHIMISLTIFPPETAAVESASRPSSQFVEDAMALPCWRKMPYRAVEVSLPDGSCFQLRTQDLAVKAANDIRMPGYEPMTHLVAQVVPLVQDYPEFLLEVASGLTWNEARALARDAFWRSPSDTLAKQFKSRARLSLQA